MATGMLQSPNVRPSIVIHSNHRHNSFPSETAKRLMIVQVSGSARAGSPAAGNHDSPCCRCCRAGDKCRFATSSETLPELKLNFQLQTSPRMLALPAGRPNFPPHQHHYGRLLRAASLLVACRRCGHGNKDTKFHSDIVQLPAIHGGLRCSDEDRQRIPLLASLFVVAAATAADKSSLVNLAKFLFSFLPILRFFPSPRCQVRYIDRFVCLPWPQPMAH